MKKRSLITFLTIATLCTGCASTANLNEETASEAQSAASVEASEETAFEATSSASLEEEASSLDSSLEKDNKVENVKAAFDGAQTIPFTDADLCVNYNGTVFGPVMQWNDFVSALGYPQNYEENNYGFVSSEAGYRWELRYPASSMNPYDFGVILVSPSMEREGADTYVDFISLDQTPTSRGVKVGDSIDAVKAAYGMPTDVRTYEASDAFVSVVYETSAGSLEFVVDESNTVWTIKIDFPEEEIIAR